MDSLQSTIDAAWEGRAELAPERSPASVREAVNEVLEALDAGHLRVAEKRDGNWITHQWVKKAVLLSFRPAHNQPIGLGGAQRSEEHTSELQSHVNLVCRLLLEKKKK